MALTVESILRAKAPKSGERWLSDKATRRNEGRLLVRIVAGGTKRFYYRYSTSDGSRRRIPIGLFVEHPRPGAFTLMQARRQAEEYAALNRAPESRDVRAHLERKARQEREAQEAEARRIADERARAEAIADSMQRYSVKALAAVYVRDLRRRGKARSAQDAANIFKNHLDDSALATRPATEVSAKDVNALLRSVVEDGKGRTAAKLRSFLRAAYALAIRAELDPDADSQFIGFAIQTNPVAPVDALSKFSQARDRTLTDGELAHYWRRVANVKAPAIRGALQLGLLLGGQRTAQLLRLKRADVDLAGGWVTLYDTKGARKQVRLHELPLTPDAQSILAPLVERAEALGSEWIFSSDGKAAIYPDTITAEARSIAQDMKRSREASELFRLSDLRRTVETKLAAMGVSRETRAQVQSHGLGGVQQRRYNRYDYRAEKLQALTAWAQVLAARPSDSVVPIKRAAR